MKEQNLNKSAHRKPAALLRDIFLARKEKNPSYSTRAFARDLGISQSLVSLVLNEKRPLTAKQAAHISILLDHSPREAQALLEASLSSGNKNSKTSEKLQGRQPKVEFKNVDIERFKVLSQWFHIAILDLTTTEGFQPHSKWIADRLGISAFEAKDAIDRLLSLGMLQEKKGQLCKTNAKIYFPTLKSETAVRNFHKQMMQKAQIAMEDKAQFKSREISGITMAINPEKMVEAKKRIQAFQKEMADLLTGGPCREVYQLNVQFFPLTNQK